MESAHFRGKHRRRKKKEIKMIWVLLICLRIKVLSLHLTYQNDLGFLRYTYASNIFINFNASIYLSIIYLTLRKQLLFVVCGGEWKAPKKKAIKLVFVWFGISYHHPSLFLVFLHTIQFNPSYSLYAFHQTFIFLNFPQFSSIFNSLLFFSSQTHILNTSSNIVVNKGSWIDACYVTEFGHGHRLFFFYFLFFFPKPKKMKNMGEI